jgi:hypothetical protein
MKGGLIMSKRIIWFSRHNPLPKQRQELKRLFGENAEILIDAQPFSTADDVVKRFHDAGADEMVIVAPLSVIDAITKRGIQPLFAEMEVVSCGDYDVVAAGRKYKFVKFVRIKSILVEKEELR